jgi:hypothetical protein
MADINIAPPPEATAPGGGPVGAQAKTTIAATMETIRAGERTGKRYHPRSGWEANPFV